MEDWWLAIARSLMEVLLCVVQTGLLSVCK